VGWPTDGDFLRSGSDGTPCRRRLTMRMPSAAREFPAVFRLGAIWDMGGDDEVKSLFVPPRAACSSVSAAGGEQPQRPCMAMIQRTCGI